MNGIFLLALGSVWGQVKLSPRTKVVAYWAVLYGAYVNWAMTALAAALGTSALSPITGTAHGAAPWKEVVVTLGLLSVGLATVTAAVLILAGFRRRAT